MARNQRRRSEHPDDRGTAGLGAGGRTRRPGRRGRRRPRVPAAVHRGASGDATAARIPST